MWLSCASSLLSWLCHSDSALYLPDPLGSGTQHGIPKEIGGMQKKLYRDGTIRSLRVFAAVSATIFGINAWILQGDVPPALSEFCNRWNNHWGDFGFPDFVRLGFSPGALIIYHTLAGDSCKRSPLRKTRNERRKGGHEFHQEYGHGGNERSTAKAEKFSKGSGCHGAGKK